MLFFFFATVRVGRLNRHTHTHIHTPNREKERKKKGQLCQLQKAVHAYAHTSFLETVLCEAGAALGGKKSPAFSSPFLKISFKRSIKRANPSVVVFLEHLCLAVFLCVCVFVFFLVSTLGLHRRWLSTLNKLQGDLTHTSHHLTLVPCMRVVVRIWAHRFSLYSLVDAHLGRWVTGERRAVFWTRLHAFLSPPPPIPQLFVISLADRFRQKWLRGSWQETERQELSKGESIDTYAGSLGVGRPSIFFF